MILCHPLSDRPLIKVSDFHIVHNTVENETGLNSRMNRDLPVLHLPSLDQNNHANFLVRARSNE